MRYDPVCGAPKGTRTPGLLLRRQLLYPAELLAHALFAALRGVGVNRNSIRKSVFHDGAGDGNRTHTTSLEGWDSAIELHPHFTTAIIIAYASHSVNKKEENLCRFFRNNLA